MKKYSWNFKKFIQKKLTITGTLLVQLLFVISYEAYSQDGLAGINEANQQVRSYFDAGTELMYGIGALLGLIGAVKVYQKSTGNS
jgi:hypothetical protein